MVKVKTIMTGKRAVGTAINRRIVITIGNRVVKPNNPILKENGGSLQPTEDWVGGVLKSMNWVKRKGTAGKKEPLQQFLLKEISSAIFCHDIPKELIVTLDQTPLF